MLIVTAVASLVLGGSVQMRDQALLDELSKRAVRFFWEQSEPSTGLTRDRGPNKKGGPENNANISSIASTGYALAAYAIGTKRGWLEREPALKRARLTLNTVLNKLEGHKGWYYHFVDWSTGKRQWNSELSSIDSALLFSGMLMAESGFKDPEFTKLSKEIIGRVDWNFMLTNDGTKPDSLSFCMGWSPDKGFIPARWDSFNEAAFLFVLGYSQWKDMPAGAECHAAPSHGSGPRAGLPR